MAIKAGNTCLFFIFKFFNLLMLLVGLGVLGCDIYLFSITKRANYANLFFLVVGLYLITFSVCAFKLKKKIGWLRCYLLMNFLVFTSMLIISLILFFDTAEVTEWAQREYNILK